MNNTFDAVAWDNWRKQETEKYGNDPAGWISVSNNLIESGAMLASTYTAALEIILRNVCSGGPDTDMPRTAEEDDLVKRGHQTFSVGLMLFGFAIECLLKALFLRRGDVLYKNGQYKSPQPLKQSHNLLEIATITNCLNLFAEQQCDTLDLLSAYNEMGRYPTHFSYKNYGIQKPSADGVARFYGFWNAEKNTIVFDILLALYQELGEKLPLGAEVLLEQKRVVQKSYGISEKDKSGK